MTIRDLVASAGLPEIRHAEPLTDGPGLDNRLTLLTLIDGQQLLARNPVAGVQLQDQAPRAAFLGQQQIGAPRVYATAADGSSLVEWIPGISLADHLRANDTAADPEDIAWEWLGASLAAVHTVKLSDAAKRKLNGWHELLISWIDTVPEQLCES